MENAAVSVNEILYMLRNVELPVLRKVVTPLLPNEIADLLSGLTEDEQVRLYNALDRHKSAQTFELLDTGIQKHLLDTLPHRQVALILNDIAPDVRTALLEELEPEIINKHIKVLTPTERAIALKLLGYPENSIGRLMTTDFLALNEQWTVKESLDYIRENGSDSETLSVLPILDERGKLIDDIRVRELLLAPLDKKIKEIMDGKYVSLSVQDDEEVAINMFKKNERVALPVTDTHGTMLGVVTIDDVLELAEEEDTEDIQKMGAVGVLEEPYMDVPVHKMIRKRAGWLIVLFLGELLTASAMAYFEDEIARAVVLALFVPLIVSSGGNSGSQAATLIIRAMALGEVTLNDWWKIIRREVYSGLFLGTMLGVLGFMRVVIWNHLTDAYGAHGTLVGLTVGLSLTGVVVWGTVMGSMLPLVLKRFGADPAASSTPFIATLVDVTGLIIYFSFAAMILTGTLL